MPRWEQLLDNALTPQLHLGDLVGFIAPSCWTWYLLLRSEMVHCAGEQPYREWEVLVLRCPTARPYFDPFVSHRNERWLLDNVLLDGAWIKGER